VLRFTAVFVVVTVLFLTGIFKDLPEAVLGAIVIHAVWGMIDFSKLTRLYRVHTPDFWLALGALLGVIVIDILPGIVIGVVLSLVLLLHRVDHPHSAALGRSPDGTRFADLEHAADVAPVPGALIYRLDAPLIFANADVVMDDIEARLQSTERAPRVLILDFETVEEVDTTATDALARLRHSLVSRGIELALAGAHFGVREYLARDGLFDTLGRDHIYPTVAAAVEALCQEPTDEGSQP